MNAFAGCTAIINHLSFHLVSILELSDGIKHEIEVVIIQLLRVLPPQTRILHNSREADELRIRGVIGLNVASEVENLEIFKGLVVVASLYYQTRKVQR
jgi:hypothetical protein